MFDGINLQSSSLFLVVWTYIGINFGFNEVTINTIIFLLIFSYFNFKQKVFFTRYIQIGRRIEIFEK